MPSLRSKKVYRGAHRLKNGNLENPLAPLPAFIALRDSDGVGKERDEMTNQSIARILASYERIAPRVDEMVAGFYQRLFAVAPDARVLFQHDMSIQRQHLAATLALLVRNLHFQDLLEQPLMDLGVQHLTFGARPEHYPVVRDALLESLEQAMGEGWTDELRTDWSELLDYIIRVMLKGATVYALKTASEMRRSTSAPG
jgi:hemoglobin-like flavoprotein